LLAEVVEESFGYDKVRENFNCLSLMIDNMVDFGLTNVTEKSMLIGMLTKSSYFSKA